MIDRVSARPGGRSTRIQQAVHKAVLELQAKKKEIEANMESFNGMQKVSTSSPIARANNVSYKKHLELKNQSTLTME